MAACAHAQAIALSALPPETDGQVKDEMVKSFATRCVPNCVEVGTAESNACVMRAVTPEDLGACGRLVE